MRKYVIAALGGSVAGALLATQFAGPLLADEAKKPENSVYQQLDLFGSIFERIRAQYVEPVNSQKLIEAAINGMLSSLDPHSSYMDPKQWADMQVRTKGEFGGLGIEVTQDQGFVKVVSPIDGTPAAKAGVKPGDYITKVDGDSLLGMTLDQAVDKMRGPVGSEITITIVRKGEKEPFEVKLTRDTIKVASANGRLVGHTAVLRLNQFNDQTYDDMMAGLKKAEKDAGGADKINGVVLDLRNNPGGLLTQAIKVSDAFLDKGEIVSTRGRLPQDGERFNATSGDVIDGKPMVVLINGGSASASEIVTGALKDHHRAIVVGTKSFGKGSVQTIIPLKGDGAMRLTTARYYTPSGRSIQALGIQPDIVVPQPPTPTKADDSKAKQPDQTFEADLPGILKNDAITEQEKKQLSAEAKAADEEAKLRESDFQLAYAIDLLKGLTVIGKDDTGVTPPAKSK
ncbi:S41 family peptidase [Acidimangrovimonas sediminis]|uniref:S41 family peptidase n=1 Tax=Acidimangrovimonas sediminis TaxID=2056283 RepID=UPI000C8030DC|nr:S41 family peptidase [Acidimangrovimonas sediminis]